jgi:hypothetical protein
MSANTRAYDHWFLGRQRRPNANLPVELHRELGRLLKAVLDATPRGSRIHFMIDEIRSALDDWAMRQSTTRQLDQIEFNSLYYSGCARERLLAMGSDEIVAHLEAVIKIVQRHYPVCAPSKSLIRLAWRAICSIQYAQRS